MGFLEQRQEPGLYSRVTAGMTIQNSSFPSGIITPLSLSRISQESKLGLARQYERFCR